MPSTTTIQLDIFDVERVIDATRRMDDELCDPEDDAAHSEALTELERRALREIERKLGR